MSLPSEWVDSLFARLAVRYGAAFMRQWPDTDLAIVKADWANVLDGFSGGSIRYGLDNLPADRPPNALQFRAICNGGPRSDPPALPRPDVKPDPGRVESLLARMRSAAAARRNGPAYCAERLREIASQRRLTQAQQQALAECERVETDGAEVGQFTPIDQSVLPPGMRT